jgi:nuclease-like protein
LAVDVNPRDTGGMNEPDEREQPPTRHGMSTPRHRPDLVPGDENAAGQSALAAFKRSRTLYPGRMSPEQRALRDQARAEQRSGKVLDRLARVGVRTLHDRRLPHSAGQLDHLVVAGSGIYLVSTVAVTSRRPFQWLGGKPCVGGQTLTGLADYTVAAADEIATTVARDFDPGWTIAVFPMLTVVGEKGFGLHVDDGVELVGLARLAERIMYRHSLLDPVEIALLGDATARACPPAS